MAESESVLEFLLVYYLKFPVKRAPQTNYFWVQHLDNHFVIVELFKYSAAIASVAFMCFFLPWFLCFDILFLFLMVGNVEEFL